MEGDKNIVTSNEIHISQLGGSGSGSGNKSGEFLYLKTPFIDYEYDYEIMVGVIYCSIEAKCISNRKFYITTTAKSANLVEDWVDVVAIKINLTAPYMHYGDDIVTTVKDELLKLKAEGRFPEFIEEITEEEFYNLET